MPSLRPIALSLLLLVPIAATAQNAVVLGVSNGAQPSGVQNSPYTATEKTTHIQKLADGTTITRATIRKQARDSQGRTMQATTQDPAVEHGRTFTQTIIHNPVERTTTIFSDTNKTATVTHQPEPGLITLPPSPGTADNNSNSQPGGVVGLGNQGSSARDAAGPRLRPSIQREKLGSRSIAGVYAEGTRVTITYPVNFSGNDQPIVVVHETWMAPDLKLVVLSTNDDPRSGQTTIEVTDLQQGEPDQSLFQIPEGYTVKDHYPNNH